MAENLNKPGVYRGQAKLATQQDLALLKQEIRQLIAGPISEISENGYIPWKYNNDGSLDIEYLFPEMVQSFQENTGLTITRNGISYANNIKALNFKGNYVFLSTDGDGNLVIDIRPPKHEVSRFNDIDGTTDSLVRIRNKVLSGAIIPTDIETNDSKSIYGSNWVSGEVHEYFNWNGSLTSDILTLSTNESVYASDQNSYFKIAVYDGYATTETFTAEPVAKFITKSITGKKYGVIPDSSDSSIYITVNILEASRLDNGAISFIPEFKFNLIGIFGGIGQRFHIEITHEDGIFHNKYVSKDYLYNVGAVPSVAPGNINVNIPTDSSVSGKAKYTTCSGIKYVAEGNLTLSLRDIENLNNLAAVENKIDYNFDLVDNDNLKDGQFESYDLNLTNKCNWSTELPVNDDTFCNTPSSGYIILRNAFGESEKIEIPVRVLINSQKNLPVSDELNEYFSDESQRKSNSFQSFSNNNSNWTNLIPWDSDQNIATYDKGTGLMVVPGVGLMYPQGNWESFLPTGNANYNNLTGIKYFSRVFVGSTKIEIRYGGKFIFKGITKNDVFDDKFSCLISKDYGVTWFSLKHVRGAQVKINGNNGFDFDATGILTDINDVEDGVEISWAYPSNIKNINDRTNSGYSGNYVIYFKLGLDQRSPIIIKSISLVNLNDEKEW